MKNIKINKIEKKHHNGFVYNLELENKDQEKDDLFWIEQKTGIISHNCLPKDLNAMIATMKKNNIEPLVLEAVWEENKKLRKHWDWAENPSAVKQK